MHQHAQGLSLGLLILIPMMVFPGRSMAEAQPAAADKMPKTRIEKKALGEMSLEDLKAKRAAVEGSQDLQEAVRKNVLSFLDRAIRYREEVLQISKRMEEIIERVKSVPQRTKKIEAELKLPLPKAESVQAAAIDLQPARIEQQLAKAEEDLAASKANLTKLSDEFTTLVNQPDFVRQEIMRAKSRLIEIDQELKAAPSSEEMPLVVEARRIALLAEQVKSRAEIMSYEQLLVNYDALVALLSAERELLTRKVVNQESLLKIWQAEAQRVREMGAKMQRVEAEQAKELAIGLPPVIQDQFEINVELGKKLEDITAKEAKMAEELERRKAQLKLIEEDFVIARERVKFQIRTEIIGAALREQRQALPNIQNYRRDSAQRQMLMGEIRSTQIDFYRQQRELADLDQAADRILLSLELIHERDIETLKMELRNLLNDRRELLKKLQTAYLRYFKNIQSLEFLEQEIVTKAQEEAQFLDGHLLWIRSAKAVGVNDLKNLPGSLLWMVNPDNWKQVGVNFWASIRGNPFLWMAGLVTIMLIITGRRWARLDLSRVAQKVYSVKTDSYVLTLRALGLTGLLAFGWPLLLGFVGWQLDRFPISHEFSRAVGGGFMSAALMMAMVGFVLQMCRNKGVAKIHFKWSENVRKSLRRNLAWLLLVTVPMSFVITSVQVKNDPVTIDSMGRLALIAFMIGLSAFIAHVLRFSGPVFALLTRSRRQGWMVRLRFIWYPLAVGLPLLLALLAGMGYYYSALALDDRLGKTIWLVLGLIIVHSLVLRWLFITQRRLAFKEAMRKREAQSARHDEKSTMRSDPGEEGADVEEPEIQLAQIAEQNRTLLRTIMLFAALTGLWAIWSPVLPAINVLEKVVLWSYGHEVEGVFQQVPITLSDLMVGIIIAILTLVAAKNLPGLLEIILLSRLPMDRGSRYAVRTICSYAITALGFVVAFTTIGIQWSSIQWLIAALGVGIGFGLQEIVANFISGLIVLFERPFRVGDWVTIGDVSGTVTRIRIRATTVMDWDRKELIVPNKDFITGRLINWSLSDKVIRIRIPVGIAYGSDTELAEKLMLKAARENPLVLDKPEPVAVFLGFGDNSLNFEVRVFIDGIDDWIPMLHKLNQSVDRAFREAGVTISFPQRDVHLDQIGPLEVRVVTAPKTE